MSCTDAHAEITTSSKLLYSDAHLFRGHHGIDVDYTSSSSTVHLVATSIKMQAGAFSRTSNTRDATKVKRLPVA